MRICETQTQKKNIIDLSFFKELGFTIDDFEMIRQMSTWEIDAKKQVSNKYQHQEINTICRKLIDEGKK